MNTDGYHFTLNWAQQRGLALHPHIVRKQVDGLYGMFAQKPIKRGEVFVRFPKKMVLKPSGRFTYPKDMPTDVRYCHTAAYELMKGETSEYFGFFYFLETMEELKRFSTYFFSESELAALRKMSPLLAVRVIQHNDHVAAQVNSIISFDPGIPKEVAEVIVLNNQSRAWSDSGFVPIMDLFNHSDTKGLDRDADKKSFFIKAKIDYQPGEQVFMRYSIKDMYQHAINYNYFDPTGTHYLHFGYRFVQSAKTPFERAVAQYTASKHRVSSWEQEGTLYYQSTDRNAVFTDDSPAPELIAYMQDNCFCTQEELSNHRCTKASFITRMNSVLEALLDNNKIDQISRDSCPEKLHRFYDLLVKEKAIVRSNEAYLKAHYS